MGRCTKIAAQNQINSYIADIEKEMSDIERDFNDMDINNADAAKDMMEIKDEMIQTCKNLINKLSEYSFS